MFFCLLYVGILWQIINKLNLCLAKTMDYYTFKMSCNIVNFIAFMETTTTFFDQFTIPNLVTMWGFIRICCKGMEIWDKQKQKCKHQISTNVCQEQLLAPYPGFDPRHPVVDHLLKKLFFFRLSCKLLTILCTNWEIWDPIFLCISMMNISRYARFESMFLYVGNNIVLKKGSKW